MKNGKRLTVRQRELILGSEPKLNINDYLLSKQQGTCWTLVHRYTNKTRKVYVDS